MKDLEDARRQALRLLSRRDHTRRQLASKLLRRHSREIVEETLNELEERGLLDDEAAAFHRASLCRMRRQWGDRRIRLDLSRKGIGAKIIDRVLTRVNQEFSQRRCLDELIAGRVEKLGRPETAAQAQSLYQFCLRRGFAPDDIRQALEPFFESLDWNGS